MLILKQVTRQFGGLLALDSVTMQVDRGQIVGLIGPNGAGKTTLINNISGLDHPTSGEIIFLGQSIENREPHTITQMGITRTYQNIRLFGDMTTEQNLLVGQHGLGTANLVESLLWFPRHRKQESAFRQRADALLERFHLAPQRAVRAGTLPYGDQRRLEMARALAANPQLLLLDEPTAGMNPTETRELGEQILRIRDEGISVLVIEHDMSLIHQVCDSVYVLNFGRMIAHDTPDNIRNNPEVIEAYLGIEEQ